MWRQAVERDLGVTLGQWQALGGGDFASSWRAQVVAGDSAELSPGMRVFVKTHTDPPAWHFSTEALGLSWMQEADAVRVPTVLGVSDEPPYLALQWIDEGQRSTMGEEQFGRELAMLHQSPCRQFGRADQRSTGSLGLPNVPCASWAEFYATQRLLPLARIARDRRALGDSVIKGIETLAGRLDTIPGSDESSARLHGDLWAGNRLVDKMGRSWLIDPASHGGHREFDLAMMRLFGG
ncbi:MAG: phosphotransferase, partial [Granulosicoccus sp.]|nr:phosphotransferase [Granulosicoccus sp.]